MKCTPRGSLDASDEPRSFFVPREIITKSPLRVKQFIHPWYKPRKYIIEIEKKIMAAKMAPPGAKVRRRFAIQLPPRSGKTEYVSKTLPACLLGENPDEEVIICSYNSRRALNYSAKIREFFNEPKFRGLYGVELKPDTHSKERWEIAGHRGGLTAAGFGGGMTGEGGNTIVVDDSFKNHEEAFSKTTRDSRWAEFNDTLLTRANDENVIVIVVGYSWHPDDLFGRIKKQEIEQNVPEHLRFEFLTFPVRDEDGKILPDYPFSAEFIADKETKMGAVMFAAIYLQKPKTEAEYMLKKENCCIINELPAGEPLRKVRYYDFAFKTKKKSDYSAKAKIYKYGDCSVLVDVQWWKSNVPDTMRAIKETARIDGVDVYIGGEDNTGQDAIIQTLQCDSELNQYSIQGITTTTDKIVRAMPWILRAQNGVFKFLRGDWTDKFLSLAEEFGIGSGIDDPIDAVSGAWQMAGDPLESGYF